MNIGWYDVEWRTAVTIPSCDKLEFFYRRTFFISVDRHLAVTMDQKLGHLATLRKAWIPPKRNEATRLRNNYHDYKIDQVRNESSSDRWWVVSRWQTLKFDPYSHFDLVRYVIKIRNVIHQISQPFRSVTLPNSPIKTFLHVMLCNNFKNTMVNFPVIRISHGITSWPMWMFLTCPQAQLRCF